jgi:metal-responsive CopG/Arc/MetJ family transcriptional regulator
MYDMSALSLRLPEDIEARLARESELEGRSRSEVARQAIAEFLARRERERLMAEMVAAARALAADPEAQREAQALAEESVALDNEALDLVEGRKPGEPWPDAPGDKWWR